MAKVTLTIETSTKRIGKTAKTFAKRLIAALDEVRLHNQERYMSIMQAVMDVVERANTKADKGTKDTRVQWDAFKEAMRQEAERKRDEAPSESGPATE